MSFPRTPNTALSAALEAADSSMAREKEPRREDQARAGSCLHAPATSLSCPCHTGCHSPERNKPCRPKAGKQLLPRVLGMNTPLPKHWASQCPKKSLWKTKHRVKTSSKATCGGAVKQQLFSPKQLHWESLHPNSGPKTRNPTSVKIPSTPSKHEAGTTPNISSWFFPTSRNSS